MQLLHFLLCEPFSPILHLFFTILYFHYKTFDKVLILLVLLNDAKGPLSNDNPRTGRQPSDVILDITYYQIIIIIGVGGSRKSMFTVYLCSENSKICLKM